MILCHLVVKFYYSLINSSLFVRPLANLTTLQHRIFIWFCLPTPIFQWIRANTVPTKVAQIP